MDLGLLRLLDALLDERSVTRAAKRVGLSQSAASHALARLREQLGDPILVRTASGMTLTARARGLVEPARRAVQAIEAVVTPDATFEPKRARRTFALAMSDYLGMVLLPSLYRQIARAAPGIELRVVPVAAGIEDQLETERVDLVLSMAPPTERSGLYRKRLFDERYACAVRTGHAAAGALTLDAYCAHAHVLVAPRGGRGVVDRALAERGLARRVAVVVPSFAAAGDLVATSDLVLTAPQRLANKLGETHGLSVIAPPLELPAATCWQLWHERTHHDAANGWLRAQVVAVTRA
jgi:DNA-binding transcriptional LysR family regulator